MKLKQMDIQAMQQKEQSIEDRKDKRTKINNKLSGERKSQVIFEIKKKKVYLFLLSSYLFGN